MSTCDEKRLFAGNLKGIIRNGPGDLGDVLSQATKLPNDQFSFFKTSELHGETEVDEIVLQRPCLRARFHVWLIGVALFKMS